MIKERDRDRSPEKTGKMLIGFTWNCAAELKIFLMALLLLCTVATLFQFVPVRFSPDLRFCIDPKTTQHNAAENATLLAAPQPAPVEEPPQKPSLDTDQVLPNGVVRRAFNPYGAAAYNFITMGTYRGGFNTFAIMGLASKPLHVFGQPTYECKWVPRNGPNVTGSAYKILPDWGYGRVYTVVVVNCTFSQPINADNSGGTLLLLASTSGGGDTKFNITDTIPVLPESPGSVNFSIFSSPPKYDYFYCGSPVYGDLSPQRVREWIVYHVRLFGERSHFALYDAGGIHPDVMEVLQPWMELGYVTVHDVRDQERFDGYYHNQFMVVNDCLHQYRYMAKWMFFFDLDEFIYVPPKNTLKTVLNSLNDFSQFTIEQMPMNSKLCLLQDAPKRQRYSIPFFS